MKEQGWHNVEGGTHQRGLKKGKEAGVGHSVATGKYGVVKGIQGNRSIQQVDGDVSGGGGGSSGGGGGGGGGGSSGGGGGGGGGGDGGGSGGGSGGSGVGGYFTGGGKNLVHDLIEASSEDTVFESESKQLKCTVDVYGDQFPKVLLQVFLFEGNMKR